MRTGLELNIARDTVCDALEQKATYEQRLILWGISVALQWISGEEGRGQTLQDLIDGKKIV
jgi:hypothetical protein